MKYRSIIAYIVFGVLTTIINIVVYYFFYEIVKIKNIPSVIIAWIIAITFAFITNKIWVFDSKKFNIKVLIYEIIAFLICRTSTGIFDISIMWLTVDCLRWNPVVWKTVSNFTVIVLNFIASKFVIFKKHEQD